jgi:hypothetical protein
VHVQSRPAGSLLAIFNASRPHCCIVGQLEDSVALRPTIGKAINAAIEGWPRDRVVGVQSTTLHHRRSPPECDEARLTSIGCPASVHMCESISRLAYHSLMTCFGEPISSHTSSDASRNVILRGHRSRVGFVSEACYHDGLVCRTKCATS